MLDALISTRSAGDCGCKRRGDVLCVRRAGSQWSDTELKTHLLVQLDDAELEKKLEQIGGDDPVISYPYMVAVADEYGRPLVVHRSTVKVDIDAMPDAAAILDPQRKIERIADVQAFVCDRDAPAADVVKKLAEVEVAKATMRDAKAIDEKPMEELGP